MIKVKKAVWQSGQRAGLVIWWSTVKYLNSVTLWICSWVSQVQLHAYSLYFFILITYLVDIVLILSGEILSWSLMGVKGLTIRHCWAVVLNSMNINQFQLTGFCGYFFGFGVTV